MADRTVVVRLQAEVSQYRQAMNTSAAATERVGTAAKKTAATTAAASKQSSTAAVAGANAATTATKKSEQAEKNATKATGQHAAALKSMGVMIAGLGLAKFAKDSVSAFQEVTGEVSKMRRVTGGTPEDVSRLRSSLKMAGVDAAQFTKSAGLFSRKLVEAGKDSKKTAEMNKMLGTSFKDANGNILPLTELLPRVGSTFQKMKDGPQKAALALALFGRSGQTMLPWLNRGEAGIRELMAATNQSAIVTQEQIDKNAALLASQRRLDEAMTGLKMSFGEALVPVLTEVAKVATTISNAFTSLSPQMRTATIYVAGAALAWKLLGPSVSGAGRAFGAIGGLIAKSTGLLTANTAATAANAAAQKGSGAGGAVPGAAGAGAMAPVAANATLLAGALTVAASAAATFKATADFGPWAGAASTALLGAAGPLNFVAMAMGNSSREAEAARPRFDAMRGVLQQLATSGQTEKFAGAVAQLKRELGDEGFKTFLESAAPEVKAAVDSIVSAETTLQAKLAQASRGFNYGSTHAQKYANEVVAAGRAAGKSDQEIGGMLRRLGATPKQVKIALSANISGVQSNISSAQKMLNGLKQYKRPDIAATINALQNRLTEAQKRLNALKQQKKPNVDAINKASAVVQRIKDDIAGVQDKTVTIRTNYVSKHGVSGSLGMATGGTVRGPGTSTSDSIPTMLSDGEEVIRAEAAERNRRVLKFINAGGVVHGFAKGGTARKTYTNKKKYDQALARWNAQNNAYNAAVANNANAVPARDSVAQNRTSAVESTRSTFRSQSGVMTFDLAGYEQARAASAAAVQKEADATTALFEARRKANTASKADKPQALRDLAAAQRDYANAAQESAAAAEAEAKAKPTSANILANFRDRVAKMQGFASNLRTLGAWGMPSILLAEILNSGLESGSQMAAALVEGGAGNITQFQSLAIAQTNAGTDLGNLNAAWNPGGGDLTLDQELANANAAIVPVPAKPGVKPTYNKPGKKKRRALGGNVTRGEPYLVGERGMEMFVPGVNGTIVPAKHLQTITAGSSESGGHFSASAPLKLEMPGYGTFWDGLVTYNRRTGFSLRPLGGS